MRTTPINNTTCIIILMMVLSGCNNPQKIGDKEITTAKRYHHLQVAIPIELANALCFDTIELSRPNTSGTTKLIPDDDEFVFDCGQIEPGQISISAISHLDRRFSKTLDITCDTTIYFDQAGIATVFDNKTAWPVKLNLSSIDTFAVYFFNGSCSATEQFASSRKICCYKNKDSLTIKYTPQLRGAEDRSAYTIKYFGSSFLPQLNNFYQSVQKFAQVKPKFLSTSNTYVLVRIGNSVYALTDPSFSAWQFYDVLTRKIKEG